MVVTGRVNELEQEIAGVDRLRDIWRTTRDAARAEHAPVELIERVEVVLTFDPPWSPDRITHR